MICRCPELMARQKKEVAENRYRYKDKLYGQWTEVADKGGRFGFDDLDEIKFKCKFSPSCTYSLTYEQFIDSSYHSNCASRPYECLKCHQTVRYGLFNDHQLNKCLSKIKMCDYCKDDFLEDELAEHI